MPMIGFGGGCHWCTEAVFQPLIGVSGVRQGFIRAAAPDDTWSEAVEVTFDPDQISLRDLLGVHLMTHASGSDHKMRGKYRSAVYLPDPADCAAVMRVLAEISTETGAHIVTRALLHKGFKPSDARFQDYYRADPERPFCRTYVAPKLAKLRARYGALLKQDGPAP